jgi:hypothetical protein
MALLIAVWASQLGMVKTAWYHIVLTGLFFAGTYATDRKLVLDLTGCRMSGALNGVLHEASAGPYFAMQALLLAYDNGMDKHIHQNFVNWLMPLQNLRWHLLTRHFLPRELRGWQACRQPTDDSQLAVDAIASNQQQGTGNNHVD